MTNPLTIPEIIEKVFDHLEDNDLCACYKVNRMWYNEATRILLNREEEYCEYEIRSSQDALNVTNQNLDYIFSDDFYLYGECVFQNYLRRYIN